MEFFEVVIKWVEEDQDPKGVIKYNKKSTKILVMGSSIQNVAEIVKAQVVLPEMRIHSVVNSSITNVIK